MSGHARELTPLDALSIPALFFAGACTWLAGAAFARAAGAARLIGSRTSTSMASLCLVGLVFLVARGLAYPSLQGALPHRYTIPGFVAGIPAVPWIVPTALGVLVLRRAGAGGAPGPAARRPETGVGRHAFVVDAAQHRCTSPPAAPPMSWYCVIIVDGAPRAARAVSFLTALRSAFHAAGAPDGATAFVNRGSAARFTFLLSPEAATLAPSLLQRYEALACQQAPDLRRYAPLRL